MKAQRELYSWSTTSALVQESYERSCLFKCIYHAEVKQYANKLRSASLKQVRT